MISPSTYTEGTKYHFPVEGSRIPCSERLDPNWGIKYTNKWGLFYTRKQVCCQRLLEWCPKESAVNLKRISLAKWNNWNINNTRNGLKHQVKHSWTRYRTKRFLSIFIGRCQRINSLVWTLVCKRKNQVFILLF